jgi:hypothetical protein
MVVAGALQPETAEQALGVSFGFLKFTQILALKQLASVAQSAEHSIRNAGVAGSTPTAGSFLFLSISRRRCGLVDFSETPPSSGPLGCVSVWR